MSRPAARWCHASTGLTDFAIITWAVDPGALSAQLPEGFEPDVHGGRAFVSMVPFLDDRFHFRLLRFFPVSCGQVNYRAYVRRGDETGVWFFGTSLDSVFVTLPRVAWKMPWHRTRLDITSSWADHGCTRWRLDATGEWGGAAVELQGCGEPLRVPDIDNSVVRVTLLDPFVGWYRRTDGSGVGRYTVWHEPLALEAATVIEARCDVFADLGLVAPGTPPLWAGLQRSVHFDVHTPPTRV